MMGVLLLAENHRVARARSWIPLVEVALSPAMIVSVEEEEEVVVEVEVEAEEDSLEEGEVAALDVVAVMAGEATFEIETEIETVTYEIHEIATSETLETAHLHSGATWIATTVAVGTENSTRAQIALDLVEDALDHPLATFEMHAIFQPVISI